MQVYPQLEQWKNTVHRQPFGSYTVWHDSSHVRTLSMYAAETTVKFLFQMRLMIPVQCNACKQPFQSMPT